ncbi:DMT family transporter [Candidatus Kuenenbacteria bacterium]|nr:DMT family transporter [Candidatus Kuenenbacteria bacterium]
MRPNLQNLRLKEYKLIWFQGVLAIFTWVSFYYALSKGNPGITITLANTTPMFTILLGALLLREKITKKNNFSNFDSLVFGVNDFFLGRQTLK